MNINYEFKKGELNAFNDVNQDLKTVFDIYYLFNDGYVIGDPKLGKGKHFGLTEFKMFFDYPVDSVLKLESKVIFDTVSKNKKIIKSIDIIDNVVYLIGENNLNVNIGELININSVKNNLLDILSLSKNVLNPDRINAYSHIRLSEDDVSDMYSAFVNISEDIYRTRLTKEVLPGLKKSHTVDIYLFDHEKDEGLFYLLLKSTRKKCDTYHLYLCLHMRKIN